VYNTGPYTDLPDNSILITANMQSETGFPSSHQLKSYVASKSRLILAARAVLSADADVLVLFVYEIPWEPLKGFAPNSRGRRVWYLARTSLNVNVKGKSSRTPRIKTVFLALSAACMRLMFGKTSLASSFCCFWILAYISLNRLQTVLQRAALQALY